MLGLSTSSSPGSKPMRSIINAGRKLWLKFRSSNNIGRELIIDGRFDFDNGSGNGTYWSENGNWDVSGGVAISDGTSGSNINQGNVMVVGNHYKIQFEVSTQPNSLTITA